ncbi:MAG: Plug domain-containing protein [Bacteroidetes bacterium]|nr:Plug domain-containing protein [Bacteroidota bacterium]
MNKIYIVISLMLLPQWFWGQTDTTNSSELEEFVKTIGHIKNYNEAKSNYKINATYGSIYQSQNLSDQLSLLFPIYIKNYGNGMNSGISMRGSGSEHTAVNWNGININNPMLGVGSFSSLYLNFTDQIYVQPGGNSATGGSGAVGGSVNLDDQIYLTKTPISKWNLNLGYGSFGNKHVQADYKQLNQKFSNSFKVLYNASENNFSYIDNQQENNVYKTNTNSPFKNLQIKWNTAIKINHRATFKVFQWLDFSDRNLQQGIGTMFSNQVQVERNYKALAQLEYKLNTKNLISLKASYLRDYMQYSSI